MITVKQSGMNIKFCITQILFIFEGYFHSSIIYNTLSHGLEISTFCNFQNL